MRYPGIVAVAMVLWTSVSAAQVTDALAEIMREVRDSAPELQRQALADQKVSQAEQQSAVQSAFTCFVDQSVAVIGDHEVSIKPRAPTSNALQVMDWSYSVGSFQSEALDEIVMKLEALDRHCRETHSQAISIYYVLQQVPTGSERTAMLQRLNECVHTHQVDLPDDFDTPMTHALSEPQYRAVSQCAEELPALFIAF